MSGGNAKGKALDAKVGVTKKECAERMEIVALLQARRDALWVEREATTRRMAKIQLRMENEAEREREPAYPGVEEARTDLREEWRMKIARLRGKTSAIDVEQERLEELIEWAFGQVGEAEEGDGGEVGRSSEARRIRGGGGNGGLVEAVERARERIRLEEDMLDGLVLKLGVKG